MVVGLGVSGMAAARLLDARGARLVLTDLRPSAGSGAALPSAGEIHLGAEDPAWLEGVQLVVTSPGVAPTSRLIAEAERRAIPVIGELELASRFVSAPIVAVTGTNGKSTVTTLAGEILRADRRRVFVGGNLGTPLAEAVGLALDAAVVEASSFQLERIVHFKPHVAIHLNLADDHFDRYRGLEDYGEAKARIFQNQDRNDWAILNRDDPAVWRLREKIAAHVIGFGMGAAASAPAVSYDGNDIIYDDGAGRRERIGLDHFCLPGRHNVANAMAAAGAALAMGVAPTVIETALAAFRGLPHRMELVAEREGVVWIDDSKGTNVAAAVEALNAARAPVILIAGGMDKGGDYTPLRGPLKEKVRLLILIGAARDKMRAALEGTTGIEVEQTLDEAVRRAATVACIGDTVLLSPACSSFDQFKSYAERGRIFQELVRAL